MKLYHIKMLLKRSKLIMSIYDKLFVNKKAAEKVLTKRNALQAYGLDTLQAVEHALANTNARFFLEYGSLLGMIRDGHFISHDDDIDFAVFIDDAFSWQDLEDALTKHGMKKLKQFTFRGQCTEQTYQVGDLTVDFFQHIDEDDYSYSYVYYRKDGYLYNSPYEHHAQKVMAYQFPGLRVMNIDGVEFHVPENAEAYLESIYGAGWRVPDPNWATEDGPQIEYIEGELAILEYA